MKRTILLAGVITILVTAAWPAASHAQGRVPIAGVTYAGQLTDTTGECSRGVLELGPNFTFSISEYGSVITGLGLRDVSYSALSFHADSFMLTVNIPVADDGSFSSDSVQYGVDGHVEGRFEGTGVSGSFRFSIGGVTECEGTFAAQATRLGFGVEQFAGDIEAAGDCGGGTVEFTRSGDLLSVTKASVEGFRAGSTIFSGSGSFPPDTVRISPVDGSFGWLYFPGRQPGQEIAISGSFLSGSPSGAVTVSPSSCGALHFETSDSGLAPNGGPLGTDQGPGSNGLPSTGSGPAAPTRGVALWLETLLAACGAFLLATGAAISHRRNW